MKQRTIKSILNSLHSGINFLSHLSEKEKGFALFTLYKYAEMYTQYETQDYQVHFKQPPKWNKVFISEKIKKALQKSP
jgi:hypothetical protein